MCASVLSYAWEKYGWFIRPIWYTCSRDDPQSRGFPQCIILVCVCVCVCVCVSLQKNDEQFSSTRLVNMALGVARGMEYLSEVGFVHRVSNKWSVKLLSTWFACSCTHFTYIYAVHVHVHVCVRGVYTCTCVCGRKPRCWFMPEHTYISKMSIVMYSLMVGRAHVENHTAHI